MVERLPTEWLFVVVCVCRIKLLIQLWTKSWNGIQNRTHCIRHLAPPRIVKTTQQLQNEQVRRQNNNTLILSWNEDLRKLAKEIFVIPLCYEPHTWNHTIISFVCWIWLIRLGAHLHKNFPAKGQFLGWFACNNLNMAIRRMLLYQNFKIQTWQLLQCHQNLTLLSVYTIANHLNIVTTFILLW